MLVQLGHRSQSDHVVDLLSECHGRIRAFLRLAANLAISAASAEEATATAQQVVRYFTIAFPQHLADEDELLGPALRGRDAALDSALASMHADHADHARLVARLVELCTAIAHDRRQLAARARDLAAAAAALQSVLEPHLALEEREVFPALRALPAPILDEIEAAMRARREASLAARA